MYLTIEEQLPRLKDVPASHRANVRSLRLAERRNFQVSCASVGEIIQDALLQDTPIWELDDDEKAQLREERENYLDILADRGAFLTVGQIAQMELSLMGVGKEDMQARVEWYIGQLGVRDVDAYSKKPDSADLAVLVKHLKEIDPDIYKEADAFHRQRIRDLTAGFRKERIRNKGLYILLADGVYIGEGNYRQMWGFLQYAKEKYPGAGFLVHGYGREVDFGLAGRLRRPREKDYVPRSRDTLLGGDRYEVGKTYVGRDGKIGFKVDPELVTVGLLDRPAA